MNRIFKLFFRLMILASLIAATIYFQRSGLLQKTLTWIDGFGNFGPIIFFGICVVSVVFFIPSFVFTLAGGVLFGFWPGLFLSLTAMSLGAGVAFWIGRSFASNWVRKKFGQHPQFSKLASLAKKRGVKIIVLARLTPIFPFTIGNYFFGITEIKWLSYVAASWLGSLPSASVYTYVGTITGTLTASGNHERTPLEWGLLALGLIATIGLVLYLRRLASSDLGLEKEK